MPKSQPQLDTVTVAAILRVLDLQERFPIDARVRYGGEAEGVGTVTGHKPNRVYVRYDNNEHATPVSTNPENLKLVAAGV